MQPHRVYSWCGALASCPWNLLCDRATLPSCAGLHGLHALHRRRFLGVRLLHGLRAKCDQCSQTSNKKRAKLPESRNSVAPSQSWRNQKTLLSWQRLLANHASNRPWTTLNISEPTQCFVPSSPSWPSWPVKDASGSHAASAATDGSFFQFLSASRQICTESIPGTSCLHGFHRLHGLASMLLSATGRFSQKTPTERNQIQLLLSFAYPISACKILHLHLRLHLPKQKASQPEARSTPTCLHRLHCLHGSHDDRCGKRAEARRGVRDPRSGCSDRVNVAPQSRSRLPLTRPIPDTQMRSPADNFMHPPHRPRKRRGPCPLLTFAHS